MCNRDDLIITNSNCLGSGATMNAVSPKVCERTGLRDSIKDHGVEIPIVLANPDIDWVEEHIRPRST
ncbi:hypothetical protein PHMEG_0008510 [Phytophthora megakarya]|uniref:Uncharacterized protein n=1 Tax=Phytophthora megakarya TaxID=4795 RepID=A0A225WJD2_9STRA|nr:hypothetical protein PHMEG_0008510 [Phytophthora megakarya]